MAERVKAAQYLKKYNIQDLFDYIQSEVVYNKPSNPREFVAQLLANLIDGKIQFYSDEEINILFKKFEVLDRGWISITQCKVALKDIGINDEIVKEILGQTEDNVSETQFTTLVKTGIQMRINKWKGVSK
ncbi:Conserved_hypothetical protein [Hexamita inflata]|uniref:Uncharacterized protein n=1 Tax=Hexamita inflata TaxID=28002 RepID=A0AA86TFB5_9EUKA|nr:Conserved hypothetical protein [Hexamita inflata]